MKVILNNDVPNLGEIGDVKEVAKGYARNYLLPRMLAFVFNDKTAGMFQKRQAEIEGRKAAKRQASFSFREKLEAEELLFDLPAGLNGKLFGAVTNVTVADELLKRGIELDRKKIEIPGRSIKSIGNYKIAIKLYEKEEAILRLAVKGHVEKKAEPQHEPKHHKHHERHDENPAQDATAPAIQEPPKTEL
ncbi:MAG: 50S ribosomal protein L9 [Spirochaetes bacterium]|nr:50S ribosomal protein L9 [Spirochaetota bacterium]